MFAKHGGHPARITPEMIDVVKKRRAARQEIKKKFEEARAAFRGRNAHAGGGSGGNGDAELKAALDNETTPPEK